MIESLGSEKLHFWLVEPVSAEIRSKLGHLAKQEDVAHIAVMPDVHIAGDVCVGTVTGAKRRLYPGAVGGDIGCGMAAVCTTLEADRIRDVETARRILQGLRVLVPAMGHGPRTIVDKLPPALLDEPLSTSVLEKQKRRDGRVQFGTLGRGNHFVELQRDEAGRIWVMVHTGSRAMGQLITRYHAAKAVGAFPGLDAQSDDGRAYLQDVGWARKYADGNRAAILEAVSVVLNQTTGGSLDYDTLITCDHNHVQREVHAGQSLWVHRKGAVSAAQNQAGIIPGSMGAPSFHTRGRGCSAALCSSSHGAGRIMSRLEAQRRISVKALRSQMSGVYFDDNSVSRLRDEAPAAYKDIGEVMRAQRQLVRIVRRLIPVLSYKAT